MSRAAPNVLAPPDPGRALSRGLTRARAHAAPDHGAGLPTETIVAQTRTDKRQLHLRGHNVTPVFPKGMSRVH